MSQRLTKLDALVEQGLHENLADGEDPKKFYKINDIWIVRKDLMVSLV